MMTEACVGHGGDDSLHFCYFVAVFSDFNKKNLTVIVLLVSPTDVVCG